MGRESPPPDRMISIRSGLSLILGVKVVDGLEEAIAHIHAHSTEHSDSILTNDWYNANALPGRD